MDREKLVKSLLLVARWGLVRCPTTDFLSRYVARLKPRCGSLALSVMCAHTVSQVGAMARFE